MDKCYYKSFHKASGKYKSLLLIFSLGILIQCCSCRSYKSIPYFQNISSDSSTAVYKDGVLVKMADYEDITIRPNDILQISIQTIDPELNTMVGNNNSNSLQANIPQGALSGNNANIPGYLVDKDGMVELPIAGKVKVGGLTTSGAKEEIRKKANEFYKNPVVNVRIINFKVTILGEVVKPGSYLINGERATLLDALGEAGDMSIYGVRNNILLSRNENGKQKIIRFDITSTDMYQSPYFFLKQGDVIYVQPARSKAASTDGAAVRAYALITSTMSFILVLATRNY